MERHVYKKQFEALNKPRTININSGDIRGEITIPKLVLTELPLALNARRRYTINIYQIKFKGELGFLESGYIIRSKPKNHKFLLLANMHIKAEAKKQILRYLKLFIPEDKLPSLFDIEIASIKWLS